MKTRGVQLGAVVQPQSHVINDDATYGFGTESLKKVVRNPDRVKTCICKRVRHQFRDTPATC